MINLLGKQSKAEIRAARLNVKLRRYNLFMLVAAISVLLLFAAGFVMLMNEQSKYKAQISENETAQSEFQSTLNEAKEFNNNLQLAREILSNEITYSSLIIEIANAIPASSALDELTLNSPEPTAQPTVVQPSTFSFGTKSFQSSLDLKESLENSSLFEDVRLGEVTARDDTASVTQYEKDFPYTVTVTVVISEAKQ